MRRTLLALVVAASPSLVVACASATQAMRDFAAPDFKNIDDTRLQDAMWRLGNGVQQLNDVFAAQPPLAPEQQEQQAIEILDFMHEAATTVNQPNQKKSHENIAMNIGKLIDDIAAAKAAAQNHDLAPAQALPATCLACHQGEAGGAQKTK